MKRLNLLWSLVLVASCAQPAMAQTSGGYRVLAAPNSSASQVAVTTSPTLVAAQRDTRQDVTLSIGAANTCAIGNATVTLATGFALQPVAGANVVVRTRAALYMVCSAATTVSVLDSF